MTSSLDEAWPDGRSKGQTVGVILAGGRGTRLFSGEDGGDKGLLDLGGRPMLAHVVERLAPQAGRLVLNANGDPSRFAAFGLPVVPDAGPALDGPLAGLLAGMLWTAANAPSARWIAAVSTDSPFLPRDFVARLLAAVATKPRAIALAASGGRTHFVAGLWPLSLADDLVATLARGERKAMAWTGRHDTVTVAFPFLDVGGGMADPFFNVNTPEDLAEARRLLEFQGS